MDLRKRTIYDVNKGGGIMNKVTALIDSRIDEIVRWGTVKVDSPLEVRFIGETANHKVKRANGYSPSVDDYVILIKDNNTYVCIDKVV